MKPIDKALKELVEAEKTEEVEPRVAKAVRIDRETLRVIERKARETGASPSDVMRAAIRIGLGVRPHRH